MKMDEEGNFTVPRENVTLETQTSLTETNIDVMMILSSTIASLGIISNLTVVVVFMRNKKLRIKIPNIFIINQSLLDFCVSSILLVSTLTIRDTHDIYTGGILGILQCKLWNSQMFLWGLFISSTINLVLLTVERYIELVHPIWHKIHFKIKWIYISFGINWIAGVLFTGALHVPANKVVSGECLIHYYWPSPQIKKIVGFLAVMVAFVIPLLILIYCYGRILWVLTRRLDSKFNNTAGQSDVFQLARRNTVKTFLIVAICFVICWSNNLIHYIMNRFGFPTNWNGIYYKFTVLMVFLNCTVNPFIYLVNYQDYQKALKSCFDCLSQEDTVERKSNSSLTGMTNLNSIT